MNIDLDKLGISKGILFTLIIVNTLAPPLLFLFFFQNAMFLSIDSLKLIMISIALGMPYMMWVYYLANSVVNKMKRLKGYKGNDDTAITYVVVELVAIGGGWSWSITLILSALIYHVFSIKNYQNFAFIISGVFFISSLLSAVNTMTMTEQQNDINSNQ